MGKTEKIFYQLIKDLGIDQAEIDGHKALSIDHDQIIRILADTQQIQDNLFQVSLALAASIGEENDQLMLAAKTQNLTFTKLTGVYESFVSAIVDGKFHHIKEAK